MSKNNGYDKKKLVVRILCGFLALTMVASTFCYIIYNIIEYVKGLTV